MSNQPYTPLPGSEEDEEGSSKRADMMALLAATMAPGGSGRDKQGQGNLGPLGSTYIGGSGDFNATHEGPGRTGLTRGQPWEHYDIVKRLARRIEKRFGVNVGSGVVNRNIAGTNTPSEHAYGAAIDIMAGNPALQNRINRWLEMERRANKFGYSVILGHWNRPSDHSNHLHVGWLD